MSDRRCGYCREQAHTKDKCPLRISQIDFIKRHIAAQRKLSQEILLANGVGPGAIVNAYDGWTGEEVTCIVPAMEPHDLGVEYGIVKYSKQARATLPILGDIPPETDNKLIRFVKKYKISIPVFSLADASRDMVAHFFLDRLEKPIVRFVGGGYRGWDYNKPSSVLSPTDSVDFNTEHILRPFHLHERLSLDKSSSHVTPIL